MKNITVIGTGIAGLSLSHYLLRNPSYNITLIGKDHGGWLKSSQKAAERLLESGPRSLRTAGTSARNTLEIVSELGLESSVVGVEKGTEAAKNRFIYHNSILQKLPTSFLSLLFSSPPIMKGVISEAFHELVKPKTTAPDESIDAFVTRRLGPSSALLVSAVVHGIYAGDSRKLSVRSCFPTLWDMERTHGSIVKAAFLGMPSKIHKVDPTAETFVETVSKNFAIYSFRGGVQALSDTLMRRLVGDPRITLVDENASSITGLELDRAKIITESGSVVNSDYVFSAVPAWESAKLLPKSESKLTELLSSIKGVDVSVINLVYPATTVMPVNGFGFLVPRGQDLKVLGVVFDSCAFPTTCDEVVLTVMISGASDSEESLLKLATETVELSLAIQKGTLKASQVSRHRDCIPQYAVGHIEKVNDIEKLAKLSGKLGFVGASFKGVSVNDCIWNSRLAAETLTI